MTFYLPFGTRFVGNSGVSSTGGSKNPGLCLETLGGGRWAGPDFGWGPGRQRHSLSSHTWEAEAETQFGYRGQQIRKHLQHQRGISIDIGFRQQPDVASLRIFAISRIVWTTGLFASRCFRAEAGISSPNCSTKGESA